MDMHSLALPALFFVILLAASWPLGILLARVAEGGRVRGFGWQHRAEAFLYRVSGVDVGAGHPYHGGGGDPGGLGAGHRARQ